MKLALYRNTPRLVISLILVGAVFLAACSGDAAAQVQAVVEAQTQGGVVEDSAELGVTADDAEQDSDSEDMSESDQANGDNSSEEDDEDSQDAGDGQVARTVPVVVPGSPELKSTDPSTFEIASGRIQLVEFFAFWCPTCKRMATTVHGLEDAYGEEINFVFLDQDDPATAPFREAFGYRYQPEFYLVNPDGIILGTWIGYTDGAILQDALERALENSSS